MKRLKLQPAVIFNRTIQSIDGTHDQEIHGYVPGTFDQLQKHRKYGLIRTTVGVSTGIVFGYLHYSMEMLTIIINIPGILFGEPMLPIDNTLMVLSYASFGLTLGSRMYYQDAHIKKLIKNYKPEFANKLPWNEERYEWYLTKDDIEPKIIAKNQ